MKKKFSLWLNIVTICLCICAIAIGVYAAQSATLKVSGSIGFEAHNVEYIATAKAKNFATDEEGEDFNSALTDVTEESGTQDNNKLVLKDMYFSDKSGEVPPIELEIKITNNSKFDITITPVSATHANTNVSITPPSATSATKSGGTAKLTYILTLNKNSSTGDYEDIKATANTLTISIELDKKVVAYKKDTNGNTIQVNKFDDSDKTIWNKTVKNYVGSYGYTEDSPCYATYFPYYITMGNKDGTAIKWLIVGTNNSGTVTALTTEDKAILETGKLLADTIYVALSAEALETRQFHSTIEKTKNINANDYYQSDIRAYLTSTVTSGDNIGFSAKYSLTGINIEKRALTELYNDIGTSDGELTAEKNLIGLDGFWLLSQTETGALFNYNSNYYASAGITTLRGDGSATAWWLRSPSTADTYIALFINDCGSGNYSMNTVTITLGIRPAFQF